METKDYKIYDRGFLNKFGDKFPLSSYCWDIEVVNSKGLYAGFTLRDCAHHVAFDFDMYLSDDLVENERSFKLNISKLDTLINSLSQFKDSYVNTFHKIKGV